MEEVSVIAKEIEKQRFGKNKETSINRTYIQSGDYRRKFDSISDNHELNRLIYQLAKSMLFHRTGTNYEDMYWIDLDTFEIVAKELNCSKEEKIVYSKRTRKVVTQYRKNPEKHLLTMHSHPNSFPPSLADFYSNFRNMYDMGIVICHNGSIYLYNAKEKINRNYYKIVVVDYKKMGYNDCEAQIKALNDMQKNFKIIFREVTDNGTGK